MRDWFARLRRRRHETAVDEEGEGQTAEKKRTGWYLRLARQQLKGFSPILHAKAVILYLLAASVVLIALGVPILTASTGVVELRTRYDDQGSFQALSSTQRDTAIRAAPDTGIPVTVPIQVNRTMEPPVYVYYSLGNYHQNIRRYVRSRGDDQLGGDGNTSTSCEPQAYVNGGSRADPQLPGGGAINPCGLIAWSFFNDTFSLTFQETAAAPQTPLTVDDSRIAWDYDREHFYGSQNLTFWNFEPSRRGGTNNSASNPESQVVPLRQNEHFMVWMRPSAQPTVRKLWGVINSRLPQGSVVTVTVANRYNTYQFDGPKFVILSTNSWVGARNSFLGIAYIVCAILSFVSAVAFFVAYYLGLATKRKYGDINFLSWNRPVR